MIAKPPDFVLVDPISSSSLRVSCNEDEFRGRGVHFEAPPFDGFVTESARGLRHLARALEHAAAWVEEEPDA